jgi:hypothetical protein
VISEEKEEKIMMTILVTRRNFRQQAALAPFAP